ncbi:cytochrome c5 family protein [Pseudomonas syringae]|nr:cytochrome c5 family protein [Pseudomonas syringae]MBD8788275.1 cytochrome c5 family protein [Pseudomonas syringae]MBD8799525.1 cytochrome c5 family protein [Pseudomonas syringae]MBD8812605.1 cytochrome c5 family protein [Pseudomonas syringae]
MSLMAASSEEIARRLEPVGKVCIQGQACPGVTVTAVASGGAARSADEIINKHCNTCHGPGLLNAPKKGDKAAWKTHADKEGGLDGLLAKAITGIGAMPPKGTCADCSDAELKAAIQEMSGL